MMILNKKKKIEIFNNNPKFDKISIYIEQQINNNSKNFQAEAYCKYRLEGKGGGGDEGWIKPAYGIVMYIGMRMLDTLISEFAKKGFGKLIKAIKKQNNVFIGIEIEGLVINVKLIDIMDRKNFAESVLLIEKHKKLFNHFGIDEIELVYSEDNNKFQLKILNNSYE